MKKASKILLMIWDIILIPVIVMITAHFLGSLDSLVTSFSNLPPFLSVPLDTLFAASLVISAFSAYLIPQIISIVLVVLNNTMHLYPQSKKERIFTIALSVLAIVGAVCALLTVIMMSVGEKGAPLP